jgi:hypothetical protein
MIDNKPNGGGKRAEPGRTLYPHGDILDDDASGLASRRFGHHEVAGFRPAQVLPGPGANTSGLFCFRKIYLKRGKSQLHTANCTLTGIDTIHMKIYHLKEER